MSDQMDAARVEAIKSKMKELGKEMRKFADYLEKPDGRCFDVTEKQIQAGAIFVGVRPPAPHPPGPLACLSWEQLVTTLRWYEEAVGTRKPGD